MKKLGLVLFVAATIAGCSSSGGNAAGSTVPGSTTGYAGTWAGSMTESSGSMMGSGIMGGMMSRKMTWQMTESGAGLTGEMEMTNFRGTGRMTISGTVSGQTMNFTMDIPAGGMPESGCAAHGNGTAQMNGTTMTGTYAGSNTCSGAFTNGQLTLTRQP